MLINPFNTHNAHDYGLHSLFFYEKVGMQSHTLEIRQAQGSKNITAAKIPQPLTATGSSFFYA